MTKVEEKISVLMSTYNSQDKIRSSLESILDQTYENLEFIILDDNSEDGTFEILEEYESKNDSIKLLKNESNMGLTKSLNILISESSGNYIARQDDDDFSARNRLETQMRLMKKFELDFCTLRAITMPEEKLRPGVSYYLPNKLLIKYKNPFIHGSLLIKKSVLEKNGNYDEDFYYAQDYKLMSDLLKKGYKYKIINNPLYMLNTKNNISELKKTEQKYYADCVKKNIRPEIINENLH